MMSVKSMMSVMLMMLMIDDNDGVNDVSEVNDVNDRPLRTEPKASIPYETKKLVLRPRVRIKSGRS